MKKKIDPEKNSTIDKFLDILRATRESSLSVKKESEILSIALLGPDNSGDGPEPIKEDSKKTEGIFRDSISILKDIQEDLVTIKYNMGRIIDQ